MDDEEIRDTKKPIIIRNSVDLQRLKLEKLMANPVSIAHNHLIHYYFIIFTGKTCYYTRETKRERGAYSSRFC